MCGGRVAVTADLDPIATSGAGAPVDFFVVCLGAFGSGAGALGLGLGLGLGWGTWGALVTRVLLRLGGVGSLGIVRALNTMVRDSENGFNGARWGDNVIAPVT